MKRGGRKVRHDGKIPNAVSIDMRPKIINKRKSVGHWESDNMEGVKKDKTAISVTVERSLRITHLTRVAGKKSDSKTWALTQRLKHYPKQFRKTITFDNGSENTIGRLRRYLPKGMSLDNITDVDHTLVAYKQGGHRYFPP